MTIFVEKIFFDTFLEKKTHRKALCPSLSPTRKDHRHRDGSDGELEVVSTDRAGVDYTNLE